MKRLFFLLLLTWVSCGKKSGESTQNSSPSSEAHQEVPQKNVQDNDFQDDKKTLSMLQGAWEWGNSDSENEEDWYGFTIQNDEWNDRYYAESETGPAKISIKGNMIHSQHPVFGENHIKILKLTTDEFVYENEQITRACRRQKDN